MTTLQTVSIHDPLSAGSVAERAGVGGINAESAPGFAGVLDAFTQIEQDETVEQEKDVVSAEAGEGDEADSDEVTSEEPVDPVVVDGEAGAEDTDAVEGQVKEVQFSQRINSAGDLSRLLSNAASIDIAGLATQQLGGQVSGQAEIVNHDGGPKVQNDQPNPQPSKGQGLEFGAGRSFGQSADLLGAGAATGGVQLKQAEVVIQAPAPIDVKTPALGDKQAVIQPSDVQVAQVAQTQSAELTPNARRLDGLRSINEIAGMVGKSRVVSGSESSGKAGADSGGLDHGDRSKGATKILQGKSDGDKAMQRQQVMNQVQRGLASILNMKGGSMKIRLSPEHLGEVNIQLSTKDGHVSVKIDAETSEARDMLKEGLEGLRGAMESRGVRVDELSIEGRQQSEFERLFGDSDRDGSRERQESQQESVGGDESFVGDDELGSDEPQGIWTELGLDAIA